MVVAVRIALSQPSGHVRPDVTPVVLSPRESSLFMPVTVVNLHQMEDPQTGESLLAASEGLYKDGI